MSDLEPVTKAGDLERRKQLATRLLETHDAVRYGPLMLEIGKDGDSIIPTDPNGQIFDPIPLPDPSKVEEYINVDSHIEYVVNQADKRVEEYYD